MMMHIVFWLMVYAFLVKNYTPSFVEITVFFSCLIVPFFIRKKTFSISDYLYQLYVTVELSKLILLEQNGEIYTRFKLILTEQGLSFEEGKIPLNWSEIAGVEIFSNMVCFIMSSMNEDMTSEKESWPKPNPLLIVPAKAFEKSNEYSFEQLTSFCQQLTQVDGKLIWQSS